MTDDRKTLLAALGKAQIDGMFARQVRAPVDDAEFLPLVEVVLTAFEKPPGDDVLAEELWEYAFAVYDRVCKEADPASTAAENRKLMRSYLLAKRRGTRRSPPADAGTVQLYTLEVLLIDGPMSEKFAKKNPVVGRTIQIRGDQTLEALHHAIFDAFDRAEEHMYEFQFGTGPMDPDGPRYVLPGAHETEAGDRTAAAGRVDTATIGSLNLEVGRSFGYWFDFGDDWWHQINVEAIEDKVPRGKFPKVTKRVGKSPPQYDEDAG